MASSVYGLPVIIVWIALTVLQYTKGHPQCIDSMAPFEYKGSASFCTDYTQFGCCTQNDDWNLRNRFNSIQSLIKPSEQALWTGCSNYIKTFLCQTCSPYAAHIFDTERSSFEQVVQARAFPALCPRHCSQFYQECKDFVKYYMDEVGSKYVEEAVRLNNAINISELKFCSTIAVSDMDYCYPELLSNPILNGNITIEKVTQEGCLCVQPYHQKQFRNPIFLKHANDDTKRLFIGEQIGLVHIMYTNGTLLREPFLDITRDIKTSKNKGDERGLLGMEFHPQYLQNGKFYLYYSTKLNNSENTNYLDFNFIANHKIRIEEFRVDPNYPNQVDYLYSRVILEVSQPWWNHNGGELLFGDDGYLYVFLGDGGKAGDPLHSGQDLFSFLGKVHRIDVDNIDTVRRKEYSIPPDNPFANGINGLPEIYAYGVRNIWRCGKDRGDRITKHGKGRILCGDVGQGAVEEVDLIEKGANYGWNLKEGTHPYCPTCKRANPEVPLTDPISEYTHNVGKSVTGGHFYRGCESPNLNGFYIYGDFMSGKLFRLTEPKNPSQKIWDHKELKMCGADWCVPPLHNEYSTSIISFGEDQQGEVYMLSTSLASSHELFGSIYKIVDPMSNSPNTIGGEFTDKNDNYACTLLRKWTRQKELSSSERDYRRGHPEDCLSSYTRTSSGTSSVTPAASATTTQKPKARTTPALAGSTVSGAVPHHTFPSDPVRMQSYLDYFKRQSRRNRRRNMQKEFKEERALRRENLSTYRGTPPPQDPDGRLVFHGIQVQRCTHTPKFWCSLNRLNAPAG